MNHKMAPLGLRIRRHLHSLYLCKFNFHHIYETFVDSREQIFVSDSNLVVLHSVAKKKVCNITESILKPLNNNSVVYGLIIR